MCLVLVADAQPTAMRLEKKLFNISRSATLEFQTINFILDVLQEPRVASKPDLFDHES